MGLATAQALCAQGHNVLSSFFFCTTEHVQGDSSAGNSASLACSIHNNAPSNVCTEPQVYISCRSAAKGQEAVAAIQVLHAPDFFLGLWGWQCHHPM